MLTVLAMNFCCPIYLCNGTPTGPGEKIVDRTCPKVKKNTTATMLFGQTFCLPVTSISSAASKDQPEEAKSPHQVAAGVPKPWEFSLIDPSVHF